MQQNTYASRLRYLDAGDVTGSDVAYNGLDVRGTDGEKIGDVDGFIIDPEARRVHYVVVDSGGWFTSRRLLLPIGHASLAADRRSLQADVTRETLKRLPEFDDDRFRQFTDEELRAFERDTVIACCPDEPLENVSAASTWGYDTRRHYTQPVWWSGVRYAPERLHGLGDVPYRDRGTTGTRTASTTGAASTAMPAGAASRSVHDRELVTAHDRDAGRASRRTDDESPHLDGRAQPGDVLGIETGGERTSIGDTAEDEDKWRK